MVSDIYNEAEIPGREVSQEQFNMICCRYYSAIPFIHDKDVLEIGCGAGLGLGLLSKYAYRVTALDINKKLIDIVNETYKENEKIISTCSSVENKYFISNQFDTVLCMEVLQYLNIDRFLEDCHRILNKNGKLIVCVPNPNNVDFKRSIGSLNYFAISRLHNTFKKHGFEPKIYGAFESKNPKEKKVKQKVCEFGSIVLNYVPFGDVIKYKLNKNVLNKVVLPREIANEHIKPEFMKLVELNPNEIDTKYKILYVFAGVVK